MTTDCIPHDDIRFAVTPVRRDVAEAAVAAIAFVLLLPGAALLMSVLA